MSKPPPLKFKSNPESMPVPMAIPSVYVQKRYEPNPPAPRHYAYQADMLSETCTAVPYDPRFQSFQGFSALPHLYPNMHQCMIHARRDLGQSQYM